MGKKASNNSKSTIPKLIDPDEEYFTEIAEKVLKEIFALYDLDGDGCLSDKELDAFATGCNGQPFDKNSIRDLKDNFDINDKEYLTVRGFMEMYYMQSVSDPQETWKDIEKHGYNRKFEKVSSTTTTKNDSSNNNNNNTTTPTTSTNTTTDLK
ncbi:hypothetical protein DLAC_11666 [Tieghemostelium lacteum]|uniref:EF-hand domain-containing protein n=1 Tax=Tieghemostelium lacteum TaxID=361077 RepID=A0A151ZFI8_TIELA|nr:hypothetical protein DLAC_11666 [Tieghemostelium lacteum]|eukprot:KYQ92736.1 hypothetical protein DLAC_11666 [Tieghemostelium lacteum]